MLEHDAGLGSAHGDGRADVVLGLLTVELAAHVIGDPHPIEYGQNNDEEPERRLQHQIPSGEIDGHDDGTYDDDGVQKRERGPDLNGALAQDIEFPSEIAE